mmetsp:Transcript_169815/g.539366  ORF Transcript_169815/g.539366 Transcript_169815/m.539366 type:complete len:234 (-) Transcript_169815:113-814(-)
MMKACPLGIGVSMLTLFSASAPMIRYHQLINVPLKMLNLISKGEGRGMCGMGTVEEVAITIMEQMRWSGLLHTGWPFFATLEQLAALLLDEDGHEQNSLGYIWNLQARAEGVDPKYPQGEDTGFCELLGYPIGGACPLTTAQHWLTKALHLLRAGPRSALRVRRRRGRNLVDRIELMVQHAQALVHGQFARVRSSLTPAARTRTTLSCRSNPRVWQHTYLPGGWGSLAGRMAV